MTVKAKSKKGKKNTAIPKKKTVSKKKAVKKVVKKKTVKKKVVKKKPPSKAETKKKQNKQLFLALLSQNKYVSKVCVLAKLSQKTFYEYYKDDADFKASVDHVKYLNDEKLLDSCEEKLEKLVENLNRKSIEYYLNNKGKSRGYSKDNTITIKKEEETPLTDEEASRMANLLDEED